MSLGTDIKHLEMDNADIITGCTEFNYMRSIFTEDVRGTKNMRHRVAQARKIIWCIKWDMVAKGHNTKPKKNFL